MNGLKLELSQTEQAAVFSPSWEEDIYTHDLLLILGPVAQASGRTTPAQELPKYTGAW